MWEIEHKINVCLCGAATGNCDASASFVAAAGSEYKMAAITVHGCEKNGRKQTIHLAMQMAEFIRSLFRGQFV